LTEIPVWPTIIAAVLLPAVILSASYFDARRDKSTSADNWPQNGYRIMRRGLRLRRVVTKEENALLESSGWRLFYTIDRSHIVKWLSFYPPLVLLWIEFSAVAYLLFGLWPAILCAAGCAVLAYLAWQWPKKPAHW